MEEVEDDGQCDEELDDDILEEEEEDDTLEEVEVEEVVICKVQVYRLVQVPQLVQV